MNVFREIVSSWWYRRRCFHHNRHRGESWLTEQIIDWRKLYTCTNCGKRWII